MTTVEIMFLIATAVLGLALLAVVIDNADLRERVIYIEKLLNSQGKQ